MRNCSYSLSERLLYVTPNMAEVAGLDVDVLNPFDA